MDRFPLYHSRRNPHDADSHLRDLTTSTYSAKSLSVDEKNSRLSPFPLNGGATTPSFSSHSLSTSIVEEDGNILLICSLSYFVLLFLTRLCLHLFVSVSLCVFVCLWVCICVCDNLHRCWNTRRNDISSSFFPRSHVCIQEHRYALTH